MALLQQEPEAAMKPQEPEEPMEQAPEGKDPAFDQALEWMQQKLYGDKLADKVVAVVKDSRDPVPLLVDMAYKMTAAADEATNGEVQEENLVSLGALALGEVFEVAVAVGAEINPADMASGLKQMVVRYLQESGVPADQLQGLQQAMNQVSAGQFNQIAQEAPNGQ